MLHTYTSNQCPYQVSTSYALWFLRYSSDKLFPAARLPIRTLWVKTIPRQLWGKKKQHVSGSCSSGGEVVHVDVDAAE